jgi:uncharacterized protein
LFSGLFYYYRVMKKIGILFVGLLVAMCAIGQTVNPQYDSVLAKSLGADEYGMKQYFLVILKTGSNTTTDKHFKDSCFAGHFSNMGKMVEAKQLVVAGPFGKNGDQFRGLFILNAADMEAAQQLVQTDPAVNAQLLKADIYPWYGSAALPEYLKATDKVWKKQPGG